MKFNRNNFFMYYESKNVNIIIILTLVIIKVVPALGVGQVINLMSRKKKVIHINTRHKALLVNFKCETRFIPPL